MLLVLSLVVLQAFGVDSPDTIEVGEGRSPFNTSDEQRFYDEMWDRESGLNSRISGVYRQSQDRDLRAEVSFRKRLIEDNCRAPGLIIGMAESYANAERKLRGELALLQRDKDELDPEERGYQYSLESINRSIDFAREDFEKATSGIESKMSIWKRRWSEERSECYSHLGTPEAALRKGGF